MNQEINNLFTESRVGVGPTERKGEIRQVKREEGRRVEKEGK